MIPSRISYEELFRIWVNKVMDEVVERKLREEGYEFDGGDCIL